MAKVVLVGAGGKMGLRLTGNLKDSKYEMSYLEVSTEGIQQLNQLGITISAEDEVIPLGDIVILAVPDIILGMVSNQIVPKMKPGAIVYTLDPACALAGVLHDRSDLSYFIAHPSHPSVFNWEPTEEAQNDFFGGNLAKQSVVCALYKGNEDHYKIGENLAKTMYAPVSKTFQITAEQMGLLEPALVETLSATMLMTVKEGLDIVVEKGVPEEAARAFLLGHLNVQLAVIFQQIPGAVFSDAANKALTRAKPLLVKDSWREVFKEENLMVQIRDITS